MGDSSMTVHYLEIVSDDVDRLTALYQRTYDLSFGPPPMPIWVRPEWRPDQTER